MASMHVPALPAEADPKAWTDCPHRKHRMLEHRTFLYSAQMSWTCRPHLVCSLNVDLNEIINKLVVDGIQVLRMVIRHSNIVDQHADLPGQQFT